MVRLVTFVWDGTKYVAKITYITLDMTRNEFIKLIDLLTRKGNGNKNS